MYWESINRKAVIVADIEDDVLLGADILLQDNSGPADLMFSENTMILKGGCIPLITVGSRPQLRRATAAENYLIPGMAEAIVDVFVEDPKEGTDYLSPGMAEAIVEFLWRVPKKGLRMF